MALSSTNAAARRSRRSLAALAFGATTLSLLAPGLECGAAEPTWCGDLTGDAAITVGDAHRALTTVVAGGAELSFDFNCDARATVADAAVLLNRAVEPATNVFCDPACARQSFRLLDVTSQAGVFHTGETWGVSWGDFDADGWPDLWLGNHVELSTLYRNRGDGTFADVTAEVIPGAHRSDKHAVGWADFDNDGDEDLLVMVGEAGSNATGALPNQFYVNKGGALLEDEAFTRGLDGALGRGRGALWFDEDLDGRLDVLFLNERRPDDLFASALFHQNADGTFRDISSEVGLDAVYSAKFAQLCDLTGDASPELVIHNGNFPQRAYRIDSRPFRDVSASIGLGSRVDQVADALIADFDNDLHADILTVRETFGSTVRLVADDRIEGFLAVTQDQDQRHITFGVSTGAILSLSVRSPFPLPLSEIFIGASGGHPAGLDFEVSSQDPGSWGLASYTPGADRGVFTGYDPEARTFTFAISVPHADLTRRAFNFVISSTQPIDGMTAVDFDPGPPIADPRLLMNRNGRFVESSDAAGLDRVGSCVSAATGDFDNDMDLDLYFMCSDRIQNVPNALYLNDGKGVFSRVADAAGAEGTSGGLADTVATADWNRDGALDLVVTNGHPFPPFNTDGHDQLFRNSGNANHWLEIDLEGVASNRDAVGARVEVTAGDVTQLREVGCEDHVWVQGYRRVHFGLGANPRAQSVRVRWPDGRIQQLENVQGDRVIRVVESIGSAIP